MSLKHIGTDIHSFQNHRDSQTPALVKVTILLCHLSGERCQLDIVRLTALVLEPNSFVAQGEKRWTGVGILTSPRLSVTVIAFSPRVARVASVQLKVATGKALTVVRS